MSTDFVENVKAVETELERRAKAIEVFRADCIRARNEHEKFVTRIYVLLRAEKYDEAMDEVRWEYQGIHGPSD